MSIARMLRTTLIGRQRDAEGLITAVQRAGLLHVEPMQPLAALREALAERSEQTATDNPLVEMERLERARVHIMAVPEQPADTRFSGADLLGAVAQVEIDVRRREELQSRRTVVDPCIAALEPFGDFSPADVAELEQAGVPLTFARLTYNDWDNLGAEHYPHAVCHKGELELHVVFFGPGARKLSFTPLRLPPLRLSDVQRERAAIDGELRAIEKRLGSLQHLAEPIAARQGVLEDRAAVLRTIAEGHADGPIFAVRGFLPADSQSDLERAVGKFPCALHFDDPDKGEAVPVEVRRGALLKGFVSVVKAFSGMSYWEKDFTPVVAVLFLMFGSLCLLDAGYGILLTITGALLHFKARSPFGMVFVLTGAATTVLGTLSGQVFGFVMGQTILKDTPPPLDLASNPMSSFTFSLVVGLAGMTISYVTAIWQRGWRTAATGSLLVAGAAVAATVGYTAPDAVAALLPALTNETIAALLKGIAGAMLGAGLGAWILFPDPVFGPHSRGPNAAWTIYAGLTGLGQDVMSHMRLFGIALSGSIMAMVINQIAGMFPLVVTIVFGVLGHIFVFLLSLLSLYIHTNRLIFLEFGSKCFDGGQRWYEPLQVRKPQNSGV